MRAWLGMGGLTINVNPREDGAFYIGIAGQRQEIVPHYGRYLRIESPRLLEFTWVSEHAPADSSRWCWIEIDRNGKQGTDLGSRCDGLPSEDKANAHLGGLDEVSAKELALARGEGRSVVARALSASAASSSRAMTRSA